MKDKGKFVPEYFLDRPVGQGAFGQVFQVHNQRAETFALKAMGRLTDSAMEALRSEVEALSRLSHPHLVQILDFLPKASAVQGVTQKGPALILEWVEGPTWEEARENLQFPEWEALLVQALQALAYLHSRNFLHGDLKPGNLKLDKKQTLKILDFGLSSLTSSGSSNVSGTLDYLAPEALEARRSTHSDLFSLALIFYEWISGARAYDTRLGLGERFRTAPKLLRDLVPEIPEYFSHCLARLLEADPERRFQSALAALKTLKQHSATPYALSPGIGTFEERASFVGRETEFAQIQKALRDWGQGLQRPPWIVVRGATGMGKSRLIEMARWEAGLRGLEVFNFSSGDSNPVAQIQELKAPSLVILQDIQVLPTKTAEQLQAQLPRLLKSGHGVLLEFNQDYPQAWVERLLQSRELAHPILDLALEGFSPEESERFLREASFDWEITRSECARLHALSQGHPGLLWDAVSWIRSQGGRKFLQGSFWERELSSLSLSPRLQSAWEKIWSGLPEIQQRLAALCALEPEGLSSTALEHILKLKPQEGLPSLLHLQNEGILLESQGLYRWAKPFYLQLSLNSIPLKVKQALAQGALQHRLEGMEKNPLRLAKLACLAEDAKIFRRYFYEAAEQALAQGDVQSGLGFYHHALKISPVGQEQAVIYAHLAPVYMRLAEWEQAEQAYERWHELVEDDPAQLKEVKYHYLKGLLAFNRGAKDEAKGLLLEARRLVAPERDESHRPFFLKISGLLGKLEEQESHWQEARKIFDEALQQALQDSPEKAQLLRNLGQLAKAEGDEARARQLWEDSLKMSQSLEYLEGISHATYALADLAQREGDYERALLHYAKLLKLAERDQDLLKQGRILSNTASVLIEMGDYGRALGSAEKAATLLDARGTSLDRWMNAFHLKSLDVFLGNFERVLATDFSALKRDAPQASLRGYVERLQGEALRLKRDFPGALACYVQASEDFAKVGNAAEKNWSLALAALTECQAGDWKSAQGYLQALQSSASAGPPYLESIQGFLQGLSEQDAELGSSLQKLEKEIRPPEALIPVMMAGAELLARSHQTEAALECQGKALEWLEGMYRGLPEELALGFERREDFRQVAATRLSRVHRESVSRERFLSFSKINRRLSEAQDMGEILRLVMDTAMGLAKADRGFLLVAETDPQLQVMPGFKVETARNMKREEISSEDFEISLSVVREAIRRRMTILTDDARADPQFRHSESVHLHQLKSILVLPLLSANECLGVIYLDHRFQVAAFSEEDLLLLKAFADQAVLAMQKSETLKLLRQDKLGLEDRVVAQTQKIERLGLELEEARRGLKHRYDEILGQSPKMLKILDLLDRITDTRVAVWIHGESGTGKELVARALHFNSERKTKPFVAENCSAIPETLLESVLFGHVKGAFTHAERDKMGLFEAADGGTLFLDEIGDMPMGMQAKLLRVLQEGEVKRVGANHAKAIDVRVVSATHQNLLERVKAGTFREDLFYRLNGLKLEIPPLCERKEDIPILLRHFIAKIAAENQLPLVSLTQEALQLLTRYDWPGNIRELENTIRNALIFSEGRPLDAQDFSFKPELSAKSKRRAQDAPKVSESKNAEREAILDAMVRAAFRKGDAAKELKVTTRHLYNLLEKYELPKNRWALKKLVEEERSS